MAIAALVASLVAVVVAGTSALYTRRQALADEGRRHDERRPKFTAEHLRGDGDIEMVRLTLLGPDPTYDNVLVEPVERSFAWKGMEDLASWAAVGLQLGDSIEMPLVRLTEWSGGTKRLRVTARSGPATWSVLVPVEIPSESGFRVI